MRHGPNAQWLSSLPVHPLPELPDPGRWRVLIGSGAEIIPLDLDAIAALAHTELIDPFTCLEGWTAGPLHWRGVPLSTLLGLLVTRGPFVAVSAGDFCAVLSLESLPAETLLADSLDGRTLPREHGGPLRLIVPGGVCYQSVKWVQQIELGDSDRGDTARGIALARLGAQANG